MHIDQPCQHLCARGSYRAGCALGTFLGLKPLSATPDTIQHFLIWLCSHGSPPHIQHLRTARVTQPFHLSLGVCFGDPDAAGVTTVDAPFVVNGKEVIVPTLLCMSTFPVEFESVELRRDGFGVDLAGRVGISTCALDTARTPAH